MKPEYAITTPDSVVIKGAVITPVGIDIPEDMEIHDWLALGEAIKLVNRGLAWALGDWLNFGEFKYGEMYAQALEETDYDYGYLRNLKWVASRIPRENRRPDLRFAHHQVVAPLPPDEQKYWLDLAAAERMTVKQLREAIKEAKGETPEGKITSADRAAGWSALLRLAAIQTFCISVKEGKIMITSLGVRIEGPEKEVINQIKELELP